MIKNSYSKYFVNQIDQTDCGAACLAMILKYWGRREALYTLRDLAGTTQSGTTMAGLKRAAESLGLESKAFRAKSYSLHSINLPSILHWENNHYVVLFEVNSMSALIADPAMGIRKIKQDELEKKWTRNFLSFQPLSSFEHGNFVGQRGINGLLSHLTHFRGATMILIEILLGTIMLSIFSLIGPLLTQVLFDRVLTFGERQLLPYMLWAIIGFALLQTLVATLRSYLSSYLGMALNYKMQLGYLSHLLKLPLRVHQTRLVGDLLQRNDDLDRVRGILTSFMVTVPVAVLTLIFSLSLLLFYNIQLALVASSSLILNIIYVTVISPRLRDNSRKVLKKSGELNSFMIGSLEGISALKAFSAETWATMRGRNQISGIMDQSWKGFMISNNSGVVFGILGSLGSLLTLWYGATQVLDAKLSVGQLVATYGLTNNAVGALSTLIGMVQAVQQGIVSSDRLAEILELPIETDTGKNNHLEPLRHALTVEHLRFGYLPDRPILSDVNMTLARGSYTVLLGSNGSGKTTLCNVLTSLLEPTGGTILWDGVSLTDCTPEAIRHRVAYQRQEVPMFYASMLDNLTLGRQVEEARVRAVMQALQMDGIIRRLPEGLQTTLGGDSPHRLSSGERQMLGIARLLLSEAEVLILDEPTATLDMDREARVVQILEQLKGKRTLLVITHRPALMAPADQVLELVEGTIRPYPSAGRGAALGMQG